jgi:hypothetical protein
VCRLSEKIVRSSHASLKPTVVKLTADTAPPPLRRRVRQAVVTIAILLGLAIGIRACMPPWCSDDKTEALSPNSQHIARSVVHTCQGALAPIVSITQFIDIAPVGTGQGIKVFESASGSTDMHWVDGNQLSIEIGSKSTITLSLHDALGVRITYRVPKRLMTPTMKELERQTEALYQAGQLKENDYETQRKGNQWLQQWEENFIHWVSENALVDEK